MAITVHLYYTGKNGSAVKFAKEMIASGTVEKIKSEEGNRPAPCVAHDENHCGTA